MALVVRSIEEHRVALRTELPTRLGMCLAGDVMRNQEWRLAVALMPAAGVADSFGGEPIEEDGLAFSALLPGSLSVRRLRKIERQHEQESGGGVTLPVSRAGAFEGVPGQRRGLSTWRSSACWSPGPCLNLRSREAWISSAPRRSYEKHQRAGELFPRTRRFVKDSARASAHRRRFPAAERAAPSGRKPDRQPLGHRRGPLPAFWIEVGAAKRTPCGEWRDAFSALWAMNATRRALAARVECPLCGS